MCCLKRPFDDHSRARIRLESEAVLAVIGAESDQVRFVRSSALLLENSRDPLRERAEKVEQWLHASELWNPGMERSSLEARTAELMTFGLKNFDALHVATAEEAQADVFASCDDRLIAAARRHRDRLHVSVKPILQLARELLK
jgi:predicted nucleic acid-binding protein